jgi:hypothetical protein
LLFSASQDKIMKLNNGHAPGHVRDTAIAAFEAWLRWDGQGPQPTVIHEIDHEPREIPISRALGLVFNCTDVLPGLVYDQLRDALRAQDLPKGRTYAAAARAVLSHMRGRLTLVYAL